jgi:hypothetical protein
MTNNVSRGVLGHPCLFKLTHDRLTDGMEDMLRTESKFVLELAEAFAESVTTFRELNPRR